MARASVRKHTGTGWDALANPVPGDVMACLNEMGVEVIRVVDDEATGKCPAHVERTGKEDRHPSWSVNLDSGAHNCFSCGFRGSFVSLVTYVLGVDRDDAVRWVRARGGIERVRKTLAKYVEELDPSKVDTTKQVNEASLALFTDPPDWALEERSLSLESCRHYGVLWDPERDMWILPVRDPDTEVLWGWQEKNSQYFRNRPRDVRKSKTLFGFHQFEGNTAVLVESPLDVVRLHTAGIAGGLSSFGVGFSDVQIDLIEDVADFLIAALDNDRDGLKGSEDLRKNYAHRFTLRFFNYLSDAKDPGEMSDEEIRAGVEGAYSSVLARFA